MTAINQVAPIQLDIARGTFSGGDATLIPDGYARKVRNMLLSAGVWSQRPQFTYDNQTAVEGLFAWEDDTNQVTRLGKINTSGALAVKATSGEVWGSAASGTVSGSRLTSADSYRGRVWGMLDDGTGRPLGAFVYDGTTVDTSPFNSPIVARTILFYKDRLFLIYPRVEVTNLFSDWHAAYTAAGGYWNLANADARDITSGSATIGQIIPTSTTAAFAYSSIGVVTALTAPAYRVWLSDIQNQHPSYDMPLTLRVQMAAPWDYATGYVLNELVTPLASNGYYYRATVAGTSDAATEPTWPTTIGLTVTDNGITWLCAGSAILEQQEFDAPNASAQPDFVRYWTRARLPPTPGSYTVRVYIVFGNTATPTITLSPINIGYRDGLTDGDLSKKNHGQQVTAGDFFYPFFNVETLTPVFIDMNEIMYGEVGAPEEIRGENNYNMRGSSGLPTGGVVLGGRIIVFKRSSFWPFAIVEDANIVILPEGDEKRGTGALGPLAMDVHEDTAYFISEHSVYSMTYGDAPVDMCGEGMRAEVMNKSSASWVESQTYNMPICHVDKKNHVVWVYTQKGKIFLYFIRYKAWATIDVGGDTSVSPVGYEVRSIRYHPATGNMYVAFGTAGAGTAGLARMDVNVAGDLDTISTSGNSTVHSEVWYRPIEMTGLRYEILLDNIQVYHNATASQAGQTTTGYVSFDHGITFPKSNQVTLSPVSAGGFEPMRLDLYESYGSVMLRLLHSGRGGADSFSISRTEAEIVLLSGNYPKTQPTMGSATL